MCKVKKLRALMEQRLNSVVEEIFGLFERTIAEYEEELSRTKEEYERQRDQLDAVLKPPVALHGADIQQVSVKKEVEVPSEQQERRSNAGKEEPGPACIKEEEEDLWEQFQGLEEADVTDLMSPGVPYKSEDDEDYDGEFPQLHHSQSEENRGADPQIQHMTTEIVGDEMSDSSETELSGGDKEPLESNEDSKGDLRHHTDRKAFACSECGKSFNKRGSLNRHVRTHTGEKPFACLVCAKRFCTTDQMNRHLMIHTGENPFSCSVCGKKFKKKYEMMLHMRIHTGEKPFTCSVCDKGFSRKQYLTIHLRSHMEEKQFSCSLCTKKFTSKNYFMTHMRTHTGEKPFSCDVCDKRFTYKYQVSRHKCAMVMEAAGT
ncbi:zinc finger protein OZF-like isoform X2 [Nerophis ophidion]|uniref:zinc finger protein OZF-like isoform X2 n=1 Tax=Nerophis ophidion TaxID=159077 RepID=UPI002ADFB567|nr:zinc finger protein OZF-like isoform X2 [Nerophis ophidion]